MSTVLRRLAKTMLTHFGRWLSITGYRGELELLHLPDHLMIGQTATARLRLTNTGTKTWRRGGFFPVRLVFRPYPETTSHPLPLVQAVRFSLPQDVRPKQTVVIDCPAPMPHTATLVELGFDLVRERVGWFQEEENRPLRVSRRLEGRPVADADPAFDYLALYAQADLDRDYWSIVGPGSLEEFESLGRGKCALLIQQGLTPDSTILDIGCGTGQLVQPLLEFLSSTGQYYGTDLAPEAIAFCRRKYPRRNFHFLVNDMTSVPLHQVAFDMIYLGSVFTHMYPEEIRRMLREFHRLLTVGGTVLCDAFVSPAVVDHAGSRGMVVINDQRFQDLLREEGFSACPVFSKPWNDQTTRHIFRLERRQGMPNQERAAA